MGENTVAVAAITLVGTVLALVVTPLFKLLSANTKAQDATAKAQKATATQMAALVKETRKGNKEAADRNGHLGEQNIQITRLIATHTEKTIGAIDALSKVPVDQHVDHQTVKEQVIEK